MEYASNSAVICDVSNPASVNASCSVSIDSSELWLGMPLAAIKAFMDPVIEAFGGGYFPQGSAPFIFRPHEFTCGDLPLPSLLYEGITTENTTANVTLPPRSYVYQVQGRCLFAIVAG